MKDGKDTSSSSWVLSNLFLSFPHGLFFFLYVSVCQTTNSLFLFLTSSPSLPIHPSMTVFKVHLLPLLPLASFFTDSRAVSSSATQGPVHTREEKNVCVTKDTTSMHCIFNIGRILCEDCFVFSLFWFKCCKKHKLLSVCQDLHPKRNYYYGVGSIFFFFCTIIYHFKCFFFSKLPLRFKLQKRLFEQKIISMAFWRNVESIMTVHIVENVYISVIIFVFINNCPLLLSMS